MHSSEGRECESSNLMSQLAAAQNEKVALFENQKSLEDEINQLKVFIN